MKHFLYFILLISSPAFGLNNGLLYQIITSHPHDLEQIDPHVETVHQDGRLRIVKIKSVLPLHSRKYLRLIKGDEKSYQYLAKVQPGLKDSLVESFTEQMSKEAIKVDIESLSAFSTRYAGSIENQEAIELVAKRFVDLGYAVKKICYKAESCSVIAEKEGKTFPDSVILVEGHIDSVGKSFAGADDNASGVAVLLEMAKVLKNFDNKKTIRFFVTNGEELGLLGATHYVKTLEKENTLKKISLVINMDMVGYNSNNLVELETSTEFESLAKWFSELATLYTNLKTKITLGAWGSDHVPFLDKGIPALLTIEDWNTKNPCYHKACDKPDLIRFDYATQIGKLNVAAVISKDQMDF